MKFPVFMKSLSSGNVYKFTDYTEGVVLKLGNPESWRNVGDMCYGLIDVRDSSNWEPAGTPDLFGVVRWGGGYGDG